MHLNLTLVGSNKKMEYIYSLLHVFYIIVPAIIQIILYNTLVQLYFHYNNWM